MRLRFTIRDLLWLTLVVGMAIGWLLDHLSTAEMRDSYRRRLDRTHDELIRAEGRISELTDPANAKKAQ
jgi:hypothetical protein